VPGKEELRMSKQVCILLATWNGAAHLPAQLDSFAAQDHPDWELLVGDDGSSDATVQIVQEFASRMQGESRTVTITQGAGAGSTANFISLLAQAGGYDWIALSDQDDVWMPDRLSRGLAALSKLPRDRPALYCSATVMTDDDLQNPRPSRRVPRAPSFHNALLQNIAAGNTILLNRAAAKLAQDAAPAALQIPDLAAHDWWLYQLITGAGGQVIYDTNPTLYYRQHSHNQIGANSGFRAASTRLAMVMQGRFRAWNEGNIAALRAAEQALTQPNRDVLEHFAALRTLPLPARLRAFKALRLYRQTRIGQAAMWVACALGRL